MFLSSIKNQRGSAIVTSIFLAAVLLVVGLGINELIRREIILKNNTIEAGKAYFAAEAGVESALLEVKSNLPGYTLNQSGFSYDYNIDAVGEAVPCSNRKEDADLYYIDYTTIPPRRWRKLKPQQSVAFPLFSYLANQQFPDQPFAVTIKSFLVEFAIDRYPEGLDAESNQIDASLQATDVLRWKILAIDQTTGETVALNDYLPVIKDGLTHNNYVGTTYDPSRFGTGTGAAEYTTTVAKFYTKDLRDNSYILKPNYSIATFLSEYSKPYLILTNVAPEMTDSEEGSGDIYSRLVQDETDPGKQPLVCDFVKISANGYAGSYQQSLDVELKLDSFLPVFDFALYRTVE